MWHYLKKAGNIVGAVFGLYMIWNFGVEYGVKITEQKYNGESETSKKSRVHKEGNVVTIDLGSDE